MDLTVTDLAEETAYSNFIITCLVSVAILLLFIGCGFCCLPVSRKLYKDKITNVQIKKAKELAQVAQIRVENLLKDTMN